MEDLTVKRIEEIPAYTGEHAIEGIRFRAAAATLGVSAWGMNVLELDPECSGHPEHDHAGDGQEEVYVVLRGSVVLWVDGEERVLGEGTLARVGPGRRRQLITRGEGATVLALGGTPGVAYGASAKE